MSLVGQRAVDFALADTTGDVRTLSDYAGKWLLLVFHRHLAWLPCREHVAQLRDRAAELKALNAEVVVVTFEALPIARAYVAEAKLNWPVIVDRERTLYRAYGMEHGRWFDLYGPRSIWVYLKLIARGNRVRLPTDDTQQLGGDVAIDPQGIVRIHAIAMGPAGRAPIESLLAAMQTK